MPLTVGPPPQVEQAPLPRGRDAQRASGKAAHENLSDFLPGDVEVKVHAGLSGFELAPWTLFSSLAGWQELGAVVDVGVLAQGSVTWALGVEAWWAAPVLNRATQRALGSSDRDWSASDRGVAARLALHATALSSVDPYVAVLGGPAWTELDAHLLPGPSVPAEHDTSGARTGVAGGLSTVSPTGVAGGVELRYLVPLRPAPPDVLHLTDASGTPRDFEVRRRHTGTAGFSWMLSLGLRL